MEFLSCTPTVFVIENRYEILLNTYEKGIFTIEVANSLFYEDNSGPLSSQKTFAKISIPQKLLNEHKYYTVIFRKTVERKSYFSKIESPVYKRFEFKPIEKEDGLNIYHISDVHYRYDLAVKTCSFFGDDLDLLVVNGDLSEFVKEKNYLKASKFTGDISGGKIPVIFTRGNHDTRGEMAENFTDYFPSLNNKTYFYFDLGSICGIVADCGEDKEDSHEEYGGTNAFHLYRHNQNKYFASLPKATKPCFAISHICPSQTTQNVGNCFDIEREIYSKWNAHFNRIGVKFMLSGHMHKAYILQTEDDRCTITNPYPVIVGTQTTKEDIVGTALTLNGDLLTVKFTNSNYEIVETHLLNLQTGKLQN